MPLWLPAADRSEFRSIDAARSFRGAVIGVLILANHYLENIHIFISEEIRKIEARVVTASKAEDLRSVRFYEGQLVELKSARAYLSDNFDLATYNYY